MGTYLRGEESLPDCSTGPSRRTVTSLELMGKGKELIIQHAGEEYRLRITKQEKLILTK